VKFIIGIYSWSISFSIVSAVCFMVVGSALWVLERIHNRGGGVYTVQAHYQ